MDVSDENTTSVFMEEIYVEYAERRAVNIDNRPESMVTG
jgi:hypothetical protein